MRRFIRVGMTADGPLLIDPGDAVTQTLGILSAKGRGKTYLAQLLAEGLVDAGAQVVSVDPVSKWFALRLGADGRSRGKNVYVFGGKHGDVPLAPEAGRLVAQVLVAKPISAVLDVTFMRKGQRARFLAEFGEEFLHLKQRQDDPHPVHFFLEEAQKILPQMIRGAGGGFELQMLGAWEDIVRGVGTAGWAERRLGRVRDGPRDPLPERAGGEG